jgi:hypothetical protein
MVNVPADIDTEFHIHWQPYIKALSIACLLYSALDTVTYKIFFRIEVKSLAAFTRLLEGGYQLRIRLCERSVC